MRARGLTALGVAVLIPLALLQAGCSSGGDDEGTADAEPGWDSRAFSASMGELQSTLTYTVINLAVTDSRLQKAIESADLKEAQRFYLEARGWLGRIEPVLPVMPNLEAAVLDSEEQGYPWIEAGLWTGDVAELEGGMQGFHRDMERLRVRVENVGLDPADLPQLAIDSLSSIEVSGFQEGSPHARDVAVIEAAANIEGVRALFTAVEPALGLALRSEMKKSFTGLFETLGRMEDRSEPFRRTSTDAPGTEFPGFGERPLVLASKLDRQVEELAGLFYPATNSELP